MHKFLKIYLFKATRRVINLILLYNILLINSCQCNKPVENNKFENDVDNSSAKANEVIVFLGNPGTGKSTLCNSIFGQAVFKSGISIGTGLTTQKQEYIYENKLYIDTPGLNDVNIEMKKQAAKEIEKALKHNNNYKLVFVAMLDQGRIRADDLVTINVICDAIKANFEYGIVFNQVSKKFIQKFEKPGSGYLTKLHKQPSLITILTIDEALDGEANAYFSSRDENREKLLSFLNDLPANRIKENEIDKIDVRDFEERVRKIEEKYKKKY